MQVWFMAACVVIYTSVLLLPSIPTWGKRGRARLGKCEGIILLIEDFAYHPAFKRWSDTFTAIPFKPA